MCLYDVSQRPGSRCLSLPHLLTIDEEVRTPLSDTPLLSCRADSGAQTEREGDC